MNVIQVNHSGELCGEHYLIVLTFIRRAPQDGAGAGAGGGGGGGAGAGGGGGAGAGGGGGEVADEAATVPGPGPNPGRSVRTSSPPSLNKASRLGNSAPAAPPASTPPARPSPPDVALKRAALPSAAPPGVMLPGSLKEGSRRRLAGTALTGGAPGTALGVPRLSRTSGQGQQDSALAECLPRLSRPGGGPRSAGCDTSSAG